MRSFFGLLLVCIVGACSQFNEPELVTLDEIESAEASASELMDRAEAALAAESYKDAEAGFQEVLNLEPNNTQAGFGLAETYYAIDQYSRASRLYESVAENTDDKNLVSRSRMGLGLINLIEGDLDLGEQNLKKAVVVKPSLWRAWLGLGRIHERNGNTDAARKAYKMSEKHGGDQAAVHNNIGMWQLSLRNTEAAEKYFKRALQLDPSMKEAESNTRLVHATNQNYEKAIAGASEEEMPAVLNNVGYIAILNEDFDEAESYLNQAIALSPFYNTAAIANLQLLKDAQNRIPQGR